MRPAPYDDEGDRVRMSPVLVGPGMRRLDPAVRRRSQCALWLASRCRYGQDCGCRLAQEAEDATATTAEVIPERHPRSVSGRLVWG